MATTTTTGAKKIENSDQWGEIFDIHNDTVEAYDQLHEDTVEDYDDKIDDLSNAMGIVETGDVATHAIEAGQYVIWKRALYTADAAITIGETLAATGGSKNLTAVEKGGLNALNASLAYSTSEQAIGKWINGEILYRKVLYISSLPNNTEVAYPHGITGLNKFTEISGIVNAGSIQIPIPWIHNSLESVNCAITYVDSTNIHIRTSGDRSGSSAYIILEYIK